MFVDRRDFSRIALAVGGALALPGCGRRADSPTIQVRTLNHVTLLVSDIERSIDFYQRLFGAPIGARQGSTTVSLQLGSGPQSLALTAARAGESPRIHHYCLGIDDFDIDRIIDTLRARNVPSSETPTPETFRVRVRGSDQGGGKEGTPELYVYDPDGIMVQLQDSSYCAGAGALGIVCGPLEPSPESGRFVANDLNHVTLGVSDRDRSLSFYQSVLDMPIQAYQGTTPLLGIGSGPQFVTAAPSTATGATAGRPSIFDPERIIDVLSDFGIRPRQGTGPMAGPMTSFVTMRGEDRGGAPDGTPELYFADPDGIYIQLQDESYCGGSGYLGNVCS
jgi:catechol 2,3-dioxygenase-like lactoylglutathione lyase family enzyme